jgi:hypothetical protein
MTLVIRTPGTLTNPRPGTVLLPSLGIDGVLVRLHAANAQGAVGADLTTVGDGAGSGNLATLVEGTGKIGERDGVRTIDLSQNVDVGRLSIALRGGAASKDRTFAMLAYVGKYLSAGAAQFMYQGGSALSIANGRLAPYAGGARTNSTGAVHVGWHTLIGVLRADQTSTAVLDGVETTGPFGYPNPAAGPFEIRGYSTLALEFTDAVFIDRAITSPEYPILHAALLAQLA